MKKILVADDEPDIVEVIRMGLESEGYSVITASDGLETIKKAKEEKPDLILLDIMMPKLDGFSANLRMKADETLSRIPILVITGKGEMKKIFEEHDGINGYLEKPFHMDSLLTEVKKIAG
ncbi:MAG TPA: response regulator [bacterium]|nr:response regulator [bacterium]